MIEEANNSLGLIDIHLCWCIMYSVSLDVSFVYKDRDTLFNTLRPWQNGRRFADDTLYRIFVNENVRISIEFSLKFVPKGPINNIPAVVQIMAWRRPGDKPLSESMLVRSLTHMCITRPQWVKSQEPAIKIRNVGSKLRFLFKYTFNTKWHGHKTTTFYIRTVFLISRNLQIDTHACQNLTNCKTWPGYDTVDVRQPDVFC